MLPTRRRRDCRPAGTYTGKRALIRRGTCGFYEKARSTQSLAGASAVVLYNNVARADQRDVAVAAEADVLPVTIPVVAISDTEGVAIHQRDRLTAAGQTMNWTNVGRDVPEPDGRARSRRFSSFGLTAELTLKPDIGAPGGLIRSTYPLELGGLRHDQRHVDGFAARGGRRGAAARGAPQHVAADNPRRAPEQRRPEAVVGRSRPGFLDNVHRQGAGMLDIDDAILATTMLKPGKISLGESNGGTARRSRSTNTSGSAVTYDLVA